MIRRLRRAALALLVAVAIVVLWMLAPLMVSHVWPAALVSLALLVVWRVMIRRQMRRASTRDGSHKHSC